MARIRQNFVVVVAGMALSLLTTSAQAQNLDDLQQGGALGAHVHGIAELNVALDGKFLELEFHTPAANVYGFEHAPRTDAQFARLREAQRTLQHADKLFILNRAAGCRLGRVELAQGAEEDAQNSGRTGHVHRAAHDNRDDHHDDHGHHEKHDDHHEEHASREHHDGHDHEKDEEREHAYHDKHEDHDDDHHHKHEEHAGQEGEGDRHSDLSVHYYYQCSAPEKLNSLSVELFKAFPALEKLHLQLITPRLQRGELLTSKNYRVDF